MSSFNCVDSETITRIIDFTELAMAPQRIEQAMGYAPGASPEPLPQIIMDALVNTRELCTIQVGYKIIRLDDDFFGGDCISVGNKKMLTGSVIASQLQHSKKVALFLCTIGSKLEKYSAKLFTDGDMLEGYVYDTIGSEVVEAAMDVCQKELELQMIKLGMNITNRYSPGYCGWPTADQHTLFSLLPQGFCGISLTSSALMQPTKSISGIIGIGSMVKKGPYGCAICSSETCSRRRIHK